MDELRIGQAIRALRLRAGWRQVDVAARARVSQSAVSRCERGHLDALRWRVIRTIATAVGLRTELRGRWHGGELDRLLDADHAALQAWCAAMLRAAGWIVLPEATYNRYGERGSIDVLAFFHPSTQTVLVVEIKTVIWMSRDSSAPST